jgi:hypothetical protein
MTGELFRPGELTPDGLFVLPEDGDEVPRPGTPTMTTREVAEWLGVSERAVAVAARKHEIRRVSSGHYLTSSVTVHRPARDVCSTAQLLSVLGVSPAWWQANSGRVKVDADPVAGIPRWHRESANRLATTLRLQAVRP